MIHYVMVGTNRFPEAMAFYDALMADMGTDRIYETDRMVGWGWGIGKPMFILCKPHDGQPASIGNGSMTAFEVDSPATVDRLHARVLELGGRNEGDPGPRGEHIHAGYWRDLDGNKFNFICYLKPMTG